MKDDLLYVHHMLECAERVFAYVAEGKDAFYKSSLIQDAVLRNLQILSESSQRLSPGFKKKHEAINWKGMGGFRNVLVHAYLQIDLDIVWTVIERDLPQIREAFQSLVKKPTKARSLSGRVSKKVAHRKKRDKE